jgi:hypothetical protein
MAEPGPVVNPAPGGGRGGRAAVTFVEGPDGHRVETVLTNDGGESRTETLPDGSWTRTDDDGRGTTTDTSRSPDGRSVVCTHFADGSWSTVTDDGAGTAVERYGNADGSELRQLVRHADGSWTRHDECHGEVADAAGDAACP